MAPTSDAPRKAGASTSRIRSPACAALLLPSTIDSVIRFGIAIAIPNLMTLSIVLGNNNAAHAGERILDVDAPAFRGASLVGAIAAVAILLIAVALIGRRRWRRRHPGSQPTPPAATAQTPTVT